MPARYYLLTGDVGGTNSRMSLYDAASSEPLFVTYFRNAQHLPVTEANRGDPRLFAKHIISPFLKSCWDGSAGAATASAPKLFPLDSNTHIICCLALAGFVMNNRVKMTNLGNLLVDGDVIQEDASDEYMRRIVVCRLINDFVAQGYGCLTLRPHEVRHLYGPSLPPNDPSAAGPKVCVGAGTGLGECYLTPSEGVGGATYCCFASEGGHVEYAPRNPTESRLWEYLAAKFQGKGRISVERVVSGTGLANIYEFLAVEEHPGRVDPLVHRAFEAAGDQRGRVVGVEASRTPGSLCHEAMKIMMGAYGCEVGACAVKFIPTGGIFVTGGLTPKNIHFIECPNSEFLQAYRHKGRVSPILEHVPLYAVMVEDLGVRGAHKKAQDLYLEYTGGNSGSAPAARNCLRSLLREHGAVMVAGALSLGFAASVWTRPRVK